MKLRFPSILRVPFVGASRRGLAVALALAGAVSSFGGDAAASAPLPLGEVVRSALATSAAHYEWMLAHLPDDGKLPRTLENGRLVTVRSRDWTAGFFPGSLWYLFEATGDPKWRAAAERTTALLAPEQHNTTTHDVGFILHCSYGNGYRLTGDAAYRPVLLTGAGSLSTRFNPTVGCIKSWDRDPKRFTFPVIIDNMMNLELLLWAARHGGDGRFRSIAVAHADTTLRNHFRADGSSFHVVDYDPATGQVLRRITHQGAADSSAWARGQAWGLYAYTMMFRETGEVRYLDQAERIAAFLLNHPRLPADGIPHWDFDAPGIPDAPRDASAGAIMCSALFELSDLTKDPQSAARYAKFAETQLRSLASPDYLAAPGTNGGFLLRHSTGNFPRQSEVDVPLNYADYYFLEALLRAQTHLKRGASPATPAK
jgi:rhamnogalacturonyl hydrolase YesR